NANRCGRIGKDSLVVRLKLIFHRILFFVNKKPDLWSGLYKSLLLILYFINAKRLATRRVIRRPPPKLTCCVYSHCKANLLYFLWFARKIKKISTRKYKFCNTAISSTLRITIAHPN